MAHAGGGDQASFLKSLAVIVLTKLQTILRLIAMGTVRQKELETGRVVS